MMPSGLFLRPRLQHFTMHCPHSRSSTRHGRRPPLRIATPALYSPLKREWSRSILITNVRQNLMPISWRWVDNVWFLFMQRANKTCDIVLNPKKKMAHFAKHWPSLVSEVEEVVQKRAS